ncbi:unnamed protein product, partial [Symbiodinium necroappetens]
VDETEAMPGDPDGQTVYVNKIGPSASPGQAIGGPGSRPADYGPAGQAYCHPPWATRGGFRVEWLGLQTEYPRYRLGRIGWWPGLDRAGSRRRTWACWAFGKGGAKKTIAALELLATLVAVKLWVVHQSKRQTSRVAVRGYTDNKSSEALILKAMTTKYPSGLVLMELAEELAAKDCELQLTWIRREMNQLADDLTNEDFKHFDRDFRIPLKGEELEWRILDKLLDHWAKFFAEVSGKKRKELWEG